MLSKRGDKDRLRDAFGKVKEEIEEHLTAINENTSEIQSNYGLLLNISNQLDKLTRRVERIEIMMERNNNSYSNISPLSSEEREIFLTLYTEESPLTIEDIAEKNDITITNARDLITSIISKGVPLIKQYFDGRPLLRLDPLFKEVQAKENLVNISLTSFV